MSTHRWTAFGPGAATVVPMGCSFSLPASLSHLCPGGARSSSGAGSAPNQSVRNSWSAVSRIKRDRETGRGIGDRQAEFRYPGAQWVGADLVPLHGHGLVDLDLVTVGGDRSAASAAWSDGSARSNERSQRSRTVTVPVWAKASDWITSAGRGLPKLLDMATVTKSPCLTPGRRRRGRRARPPGRRRDRDRPRRLLRPQATAGGIRRRIQGRACREPRFAPAEAGGA